MNERRFGRLGDPFHGVKQGRFELPEPTDEEQAALEAFQRERRAAYEARWDRTGDRRPTKAHIEAHDIVRCRDTDWLVLEVRWVDEGTRRLLWVRGLTGIMRGHEQHLVDDFEEAELKPLEQIEWRTCEACCGTGRVRLEDE